MQDVLMDDNEFPVINSAHFATVHGYLTAVEQMYPHALEGTWGAETRKTLISIWHLNHNLPDPYEEELHEIKTKRRRETDL